MAIYKDKYQISTNKIKKDFKFILISDLHINRYHTYNFLKSLVKQIKKESPTYVFVAGDLVSNADTIYNVSSNKKLTYLLKNISKICKCFICFGNHDFRDGMKFLKEDIHNYIVELTKENDIVLVNNDYIVIDDLCISGYAPLAQSYKYELKSIWLDSFYELMPTIDESIYKNKYNIMLVHSPILGSYLMNNLEQMKKRKSFDERKVNKLIKYMDNVDLVLSGHMHDGLVPKILQRLKIVSSDRGLTYKAEAAKSIKFQTTPLCRGVHDVDNGKLVISGGITKASYPTFGFSLLNKFLASDITIIEVKHE